MPRGVFPREDLTGRQFGDWTVVEQAPHKTGRRREWHVRCACGQLATRHTAALKNGQSTRCRHCSRRARVDRFVESNRRRHAENRKRNGPHWNVSVQDGYVILTTTIPLGLALAARAAGVKGIAINSKTGGALHRIRQHVLSWEHANGKPLPAGHQIHHRDGDRSNNDPSNLEEWVVGVSQPSGQRINDLRAEIDELKSRLAELDRATI